MLELQTGCIVVSYSLLRCSSQTTRKIELFLCAKFDLVDKSNGGLLLHPGTTVDYSDQIGHMTLLSPLCAIHSCSFPAENICRFPHPWSVRQSSFVTPSEHLKTWPDHVMINAFSWERWHFEHRFPRSEEMSVWGKKNCHICAALQSLSNAVRNNASLDFYFSSVRCSIGMSTISASTHVWSRVIEQSSHLSCSMGHFRAYQFRWSFGRRCCCCCSPLNVISLASEQRDSARKAAANMCGLLYKMESVIDRASEMCWWRTLSPPKPGPSIINDAGHNRFGRKYRLAAVLFKRTRTNQFRDRHDSSYLWWNQFNWSPIAIIRMEWAE